MVKATTLQRVIMQTGMTPIEMAEKLEQQAASKIDYMAPASAIKFSVSPTETRNTKIVLDRGGRPTVGMPLTNNAEAQLRDFVGMPASYWKRCRSEAPELLSDNVNHWLRDYEETPRMVRTMDHQCRAILSDRYRALDNVELFGAVYPILQEKGVQIHSANISEDYFYLQGFVPSLRKAVKVGDEVELGITVKNSEVGKGRLVVNRWVMRLLCTNGMKGQEILGKTPRGRQDQIIEADYSILRDETRELNDQAFWNTVHDVVDANVSEMALNEEVNKLKEAAEQPIEIEAPKAVEVITQHCGLSETAGHKILNNLIKGHDVSRWGYVNAVTAVAHDKDLTFDQNIEMQEAGAKVLELPQKTWAKLAERV